MSNGGGKEVVAGVEVVPGAAVASRDASTREWAHVGGVDDVGHTGRHTQDTAAGR